jgi:penicillin G amidase
VFEIKFTEDLNRTPGFICKNVDSGFYGLGHMHGHYRPLQTLLLVTAGRGRLCAEIAPKRQLLHIDRLTHRYDLVRKGAQEAQCLPTRTRRRLDAYCRGVADGIDLGGVGFENHLLMTQLELPTPASLLSSFLLASFMGLAESQGRMELSLVRALQEGADESLLQTMFHPHLVGWDPQWLRGLDIPELGENVRPKVGGSNAWAVSGQRTQSGAALLAGDPHLQINQLPALFFEVRARVGDDYWLGATVPGLPGLAMGRNRNVSWAGTFAVADNIDYQSFDPAAAKPRSIHIERRYNSPFSDVILENENGVNDQLTGKDLVESWAGIEGAAQAMTAYLDLMLASTCSEAESVLRQASNFSLHFVLADRSGDVRYTQVGRIPKRSAGWSGLFPVDARGPKKRIGFYEGKDLPRLGSDADLVCSANEARLGPDGAVLSTLAQPSYRIERIRSLLESQNKHDVSSFQEIQLDLVCLREKRLRSVLLSHMDEGFLKILLSRWDGHCGPQSEGMSVFKLAVDLAVEVLSKHLGKDWFKTAYSQSELSVWWCEALDRAIVLPQIWTEDFTAEFKTRLRAANERNLNTWGEVQTVRFCHMIFGGLPRFFGFDQGPYALPGAISTVCQGNVFRINNDEIAVGPAYRFIAPMDEDCLHTSLPGGIHGSRFSSTYVCWLDDYLNGRYHEIMPPTEEERVIKR